MTSRDLLISWLKDAYAMEQAQIEILTRYIKDFSDYSRIKTGLEIHLAETKQQADDVQTCLKSLGSDVSGGKNLLGKLTGIAQGVATNIHKDDIVKDLLVLYGGENFEYACYTSLVAAANELGEDEIKTICQRIASQEKNAADMVFERIPVVTIDLMAKI